MQSALFVLVITALWVISIIWSLNIMLSVMSLLDHHFLHKGKKKCVCIFLVDNMLSTNSIICFYFICHLIFQRHFFRWLNFPSFLQTCPCCILWRNGDTVTESSDKLPGLLVEQIAVLVKNLSPNYIFCILFNAY